MARIKMMALGATASLLAVATSAHAATVTFDDVTTFNTLSFASEQGLDFAHGGGLGVAYLWGGASPNGNGTPNLILGFNPTSVITITKTGGGTFSVDTIDLVISWYSGATSTDILVNGTPLTITNTLTTYTLGLNNITALTIGGLASGDGYWSADNIVYSAGVPEPATWAMMVAGFGLAGAAMRRSNRKVAVSYS